MVNTKREPTRGDSRLDEIKQAAVKLFYQRGYAATELRTIAKEVGLHVSTLYNYIESKEQLLYLILLDDVEVSVRDLDRALEGVDDPVDRLREAIRSHARLLATLRYTGWIGMTERRLLTGAYADAIRQLILEYQATWKVLLRDAIASGGVRPVGESVTVNGILMMTQSVSRWFKPGDRLTADEVGDQYADIVMNGLLPADAPEREEGVA